MQNIKFHDSITVQLLHSRLQVKKITAIQRKQINAFDKVKCLEILFYLLKCSSYNSIKKTYCSNFQVKCQLHKWTNNQLTGVSRSDLQMLISIFKLSVCHRDIKNRLTEITSNLLTSCVLLVQLNKVLKTIYNFLQFSPLRIICITLLWYKICLFEISD